MSRLLIAVLALFGATLFSPSAIAGAGKDCKKTDPRCEAWQSGTGSLPGKPTPCLVTISAPTFGGQIGLDVRDASGKSRWDKPRIKKAKPGVMQYKIGCGWLKEPTAEVYLCVRGHDGKEYYSRRTRGAGELSEVLLSRRLEMCLKGAECPKFVASTPKPQ